VDVQNMTQDQLFKLSSVQKVPCGTPNRSDCLLDS